jgi:hypothetical protein
MAKEISVRTSTGTYLYKVSEYGGTYYCYKWKDSLFGSWIDIGKARNLEDAISLIKSHASQYGSIYGVNIN